MRFHKIVLFLVVLVFLASTVSSARLYTWGQAQNIYIDTTNGYLHSYDGMDYYYGSDGAVRIVKDGIEQGSFQFGMSAMDDKTPVVRTSSDYEWDWSVVSNTSDLIELQGIQKTYATEDYKWSVTLTIGRYAPLKINNYAENASGRVLTNTNFFYLFSLNPDETKKAGYYDASGDLITHSYNPLSISADTKIESKEIVSSLDQNKITTSKFNFNFQDVVDTGYDINYLYFGKLDNLYGNLSVTDGYAIGIEKDKGVFADGVKYEIDPTIYPPDDELDGAIRYTDGIYDSTDTTSFTQDNVGHIGDNGLAYDWERMIMQFDLTGLGLVTDANFVLTTDGSHIISGEIGTFDLNSITDVNADGSGVDGSESDGGDWNSTTFEKVVDNWFDETIPASGSIGADVSTAWNNAITATRNYLAFRIGLDAEHTYTNLNTDLRIDFCGTGESGGDCDGSTTVHHIDYTLISNATPDINLLAPNGNQYVGGADVNISFNVQDEDLASETDGALLVDLYYSINPQEFGNLIASDINLMQNNACDDTNFTVTPTHCTYLWNTDGNSIADGNYYIDLNISDDSDANAISSSANSFQIDNTKPITYWDGNHNTWQNTDANVHLTCSDSGSGCKTTKYRLDLDSSSTISYDVWKAYDDFNQLHNADNNIGWLMNGDENAITAYTLDKIEGSASLKIDVDVSIGNGWSSPQYNTGIIDVNSLGLQDGNFSVWINFPDTTNFTSLLLYWCADPDGNCGGANARSYIYSFASTELVIGWKKYSAKLTDYVCENCSGNDIGLETFSQFTINPEYNGSQTDFNWLIDDMRIETSDSILFSEDGNWTIDFNSTDVAGNIGDTNTFYVLIDKTLPDIYIWQPLVDGVDSNTLVTFDVNESSLITDVAVNINSTASGDFVFATHCTPFDIDYHCSYVETGFVPNFDNNLSILATNAVGDTNQSDLNFVLNNAPAITIQAPNGNQYIGGDDLNISFRVTDSDLNGEFLDGLFVTLAFSPTSGGFTNTIISGLDLFAGNCDSNTFNLGVNCSFNWNADLNGVADGNYFLDANVFDRYDFNAQDSGAASFFMDNSAPDIFINRPAQGTTVSARQIDFNVMENGLVGTISAIINGAASTVFSRGSHCTLVDINYTCSYVENAVKAGDNNITIRALNTGGGNDQNEVSHTFIFNDPATGGSPGGGVIPPPPAPEKRFEVISIPETVQASRGIGTEFRITIKNISTEELSNFEIRFNEEIAPLINTISVPEVIGAGQIIDFVYRITPEEDTESQTLVVFFFDGSFADSQEVSVLVIDNLGLALLAGLNSPAFNFGDSVINWNILLFVIVVFAFLAFINPLPKQLIGLKITTLVVLAALLISAVAGA